MTIELKLSQDYFSKLFIVLLFKKSVLGSSAIYQADLARKWECHMTTAHTVKLEQSPGYFTSTLDIIRHYHPVAKSANYHRKGSTFMDFDCPGRSNSIKDCNVHRYFNDSNLKGNHPQSSPHNPFKLYHSWIKTIFNSLL